MLPDLLLIGISYPYIRKIVAGNSPISRIPRGLDGGNSSCIAYRTHLLYLAGLLRRDCKENEKKKKGQTGKQAK